MLNIRNVNHIIFKQEIQTKDLIIYGAGNAAASYFSAFFQDVRIEMVVDSNEKKRGDIFQTGEQKFFIGSMEDLLKIVREGGKIAIFITPTNSVGEIIRFLDGITELNNVDCYVGMLMRELCEPQNFSFTKGSPVIPKKIHYCWFGGKEIPFHLKKCIQSWYDMCSDYEIIRWDESNYDYTKNCYMHEAYMAGKFGFVSDYARLDIIYNEGGLYFDTDVELLRSPDQLLNDQAFFITMCYKVNTGSGFGAVPHHPFIRELKDVYNLYSFMNKDGTMNLLPCTYYQDPVFLKKGFQLNNEYQKIDQMVLYPQEVGNPWGQSRIFDNTTVNTISIHHGDLSWMPQDDLKQLNFEIDWLKQRCEIK